MRVCRFIFQRDKYSIEFTPLKLRENRIQELPRQKNERRNNILYIVSIEIHYSIFFFNQNLKTESVFFAREE